MSDYGVLEIFDSVQGEGRYMGMPVTFVRFAGCNLNCSWCDTKEQMKSVVTLMTADEIVEQIHLPCVVFTGGEPTLYDLETVCTKLLEKFGGDKLFTAIETNGTGNVPECIDFVACSPKPQSGYVVHYSIQDRVKRRPVDFKYVVDGNLETMDIYQSDRAFDMIVYLQPEFYSGAKSVEKAFGMLEKLRDTMDVRMGIQAHKYWEVR